LGADTILPQFVIRFPSFIGCFPLLFRFALPVPVLIHANYFRSLEQSPVDPNSRLVHAGRDALRHRLS
jgi:hypothetical protein